MLSNHANVTKATLIAPHENIYNTESFQQTVTKCCLPNEVLELTYWADVIGLIPEGEMHISKHFLQFLQKIRFKGTLHCLHILFCFHLRLNIAKFVLSLRRN